MNRAPEVSVVGSSAADLRLLEQLAHAWDELLPLPVINRRIGFDALIGLVPGVGDAVSALVASWALVVGLRLGAPPSVMSRILLNIGIDALVGAVPLLGDIFDIGWHAQRRNVALLKRWRDDPAGTRRGSRVVFATLAIVVVLIGVAAIGLVWLLLAAIF